MEIKLLSCPLCLKPHFEGVDALRSSLITVATSPISCPVCNELLMGLDKLTIHLFSHIANQIILDNLSKPADQIQHVNETVIDNKHADMFQETAPPQTTNQCIQNKPVGEEEPIDINNRTCVETAINIMEVDLSNKNYKKSCIRCDICNFCFSDENILEMHQKLLHQTQADKKTGLHCYHCHLCSKKFKMRGSLMVHLRVAHYGFGNVDNCHENCRSSSDSMNKNKLGNGSRADYNDVSGEVPENVEQYKVMKNADNKQWACDICSKLFTTKYFLKKHKRLHTGEMPYFCVQCNKSFTFQQSYHKHMLYHSSEKPHICGECGRAFKELSTLHNHERIHSGERPFACETCGKCFRQRVSYLVHRRIHTGAMPYKCTACDKSFRYKVSQKSHKCTANPPGTVVRAPDLVAKLMEKSIGRVNDGSNLYTNNNQQNGNILNDKSVDIQKTNSVINMPQTNGMFQNVPVAATLEEMPKRDDSLHNTTQNVAIYSPNENLLKFCNNLNTIIFNCDGQIIGQNFTYDGQNIIAVNSNLNQDVNNPENMCSVETSKVELGNDVMAQSADSNQNKMPLSYNHDQGSPDFFSMVLSPTLPDVQSLCLSNSSSADSDESLSNRTLETINEESFKRLLYGSTE